MSNIIKLEEIPEGPYIAGSVTVSLHELDRMRADHAKLRKLAEDLQSKQMQVLLITEEYYKDYEYDRYGGKHFPVNRRRILSQEYKNLDEVKEDLKKIVAEEYLNKAENLEKELYELEKQFSKGKTEFWKLSTELEKTKKDLVKSEEDRVQDVEKINILELDAIEYESQIQDINSRLKLALEELEKEKHKKGFWSFLK